MSVDWDWIRRENSTHKTCNGCGEQLLLSEYSKNKRGKNGLHARCKFCRSYESKGYNLSEDAKEKAKIRMRKYRQTDTYKLTQRNYQHRRREKKLSTMDGSIPEKRIVTQELLDLMDKQDNKCVVCMVDITITTAHLDHIIPLSKDGKHTLDNIQWLCPTCNCSKGNKMH